jgi:hypothetical protein
MGIEKMMQAVLDAIPWGKENAIISDRICEIAKINDPDFRTNFKTREIIADLIIEEGQPICSSKNGYWRTKKNIDLWTYADELKGRADGIMRRREAILNIIQGGTKQQELFGETIT